MRRARPTHAGGKLRRRAQKPSLSDSPVGGLGRAGTRRRLPLCQGGPHSSGMHVNTPMRTAQWALVVRSTLHGSIAAAAHRMRAVPAARRCTRVRVLCRPRRAEPIRAHAALLTCPQRVGRGSRHPPPRETPRAGHRGKRGKRSGSLSKRMDPVLVVARHPHVSAAGSPVLAEAFCCAKRRRASTPSIATAVSCRRSGYMP